MFEYFSTERKFSCPDSVPRDTFLRRVKRTFKELYEIQIRNSFHLATLTFPWSPWKFRAYTSKHILANFNFSHDPLVWWDGPFNKRPHYFKKLNALFLLLASQCTVCIRACSLNYDMFCYQLCMYNKTTCWLIRK